MTPSSAPEPAPLASADNLRDVAGPGYRAADGTPLRSGVLFRSNKLTLSAEDLETVAGLGLRGIHDLRRDSEVAEVPDTAVPGAAWHQHDVLGVSADDAAELTEPAHTVAMLEQAYADFVTHPRSRAAFGSLLRHLAQDEGPQLFHCQSGKDRAGWAAYLVLWICGVDEETRLADYLLSNERTRGSRATFEERVAAARGEDFLAVVAPALEVREAYLAISLRLVADEYGGLAGYLRHGLGLDEAVPGALRARLLARPEPA